MLFNETFKGLQTRCQRCLRLNYIEEANLWMWCSCTHLVSNVYELPHAYIWWCVSLPLSTTSAPSTPPPLIYLSPPPSLLVKISILASHLHHDGNSTTTCGLSSKLILSSCRSITHCLALRSVPWHFLEMYIFKIEGSSKIYTTPRPCLRWQRYHFINQCFNTSVRWICKEWNPTCVKT